MRMFARWRFINPAVMLGIIAAVSTPMAAQAQPEDMQPDQATEGLLEQYAGSYRYAEDHEHGRAIVKQALDEALTQIPRIFRPLVRRHLEKRDYFVTSFSIRPRGDRVAFRAVSYKVFAVSTYPGVTRELVSKKGRVTKVTQQFREGHFEQILENRRGQQHNLFTLRDEGRTIHVKTTFTSRYLDRPVRFELTYSRVGPVRRPHKVRPRPPHKVRPRPPRKVRPRPRPPFIVARPFRRLKQPRVRTLRVTKPGVEPLRPNIRRIERQEPAIRSVPQKREAQDEVE